MENKVQIGKTFGNWVALKEFPERRKAWGTLLKLHVKCSVCGTIKYSSWPDLRKNKTHGCMNCRDIRRNTAFWGRIPDALDRKLAKRTSIIISRCYNVNNNQYKNYGARGITVHSSFLEDRVLFVNYLKNLPGMDLKKTIDRIDTNGNYEPGNIRWLSQADNNRNMRKTIFITYWDQKIPAKEFAERYCHKYHPQTIVRLAKRGMTGEDILKKIKGSHKEKVFCA